MNIFGLASCSSCMFKLMKFLLLFFLLTNVAIFVDGNASSSLSPDKSSNSADQTLFLLNYPDQNDDSRNGTYSASVFKPREKRSLNKSNSKVKNLELFFNWTKNQFPQLEIETGNNLSFVAKSRQKRGWSAVGRVLWNGLKQGLRQGARQAARAAPGVSRGAISVARTTSRSAFRNTIRGLRFTANALRGKNQVLNQFLKPIGTGIKNTAKKGWDKLGDLGDFLKNSKQAHAVIFTGGGAGTGYTIAKLVDENKSKGGSGQSVTNIHNHYYNGTTPPPKTQQTGEALKVSLASAPQASASKNMNFAEMSNAANFKLSATDSKPRQKRDFFSDAWDFVKDTVKDAFKSPTQQVIEGIQDVVTLIKGNNGNEEGGDGGDDGLSEAFNELGEGIDQVGDMVHNGFTYMGERFDVLDKNIEDFRDENRAFHAGTHVLLQNNSIENRQLHGQTHGMLRDGFEENRNLHEKTQGMLHEGFQQNEQLHGLTHQKLDQGFQHNQQLHGLTHQMLEENRVENRHFHGITHHKLDRNLAMNMQQHGVTQQKIDQGFEENRGLHGMTHQMVHASRMENRGLHGQTHNMLDRNLAAMQTGFAVLGHGVDRNYEAIVHGTIQMHRQFGYTQNLINQGRYENAQNFEQVKQGIAQTYDAVNQGRYENAQNFQQVKQGIAQTYQAVAQTYNAVNQGRAENAQNFQQVKEGIAQTHNAVAQTYNAVNQGRHENAVNFWTTQNLIKQGQREAAMNFALTQDLITDGRIENAINFQSTFYLVNKAREENQRGFSVLAKMNKDNFEATIQNRLESRFRFNLVNGLLGRNYEASFKGRKEAQAYFNATVDLIEKGQNQEALYFATTAYLLQQLKNDSLYQEEKAELSRYFYYSSSMNLLNATRYEMEWGFEEVLSSINQMSIEMREGFIQVLQSIRQSRVEPILSKLTTFIEYFIMETTSADTLNREDLILKFEKEQGILYYMTQMRTPQQTDSLHSLLNDILNQHLAIPHHADDHIGFTALDLLWYGTNTYVEVMDFTLNGFKFLADEYYQKRNFDKYNEYRSTFISTFDDFYKSLALKESGVIDKVIEILKQTKMKVPRVEKLVNQRIQQLQQAKSILHQTNAVLTREIPQKIQIKLDFKESQLKVPILDWKSGSRVQYAIQFVKNEEPSSIGAWSESYIVDDIACPIVHIPPTTKQNQNNDTFVLIFRRFDQGEPKLVRVLEPSNKDQQFHDMDRDLFDAAGMPNQKMALTVVETLLTNGANKTTIFENGQCTIHAAAKELNTDVLEKLVQNDTQLIDQVDVEGNSALHLVLISNYPKQYVQKAVKTLLDLGADINAYNDYAMTPLLISVDRNETDLVQQLLQSPKIDPNQPYIENMTALHFAARNGQTAILTLLLNHSSIDLNYNTDELATPLHIATIYGQPQSMKLLCTHSKTDVNAKTLQSLTALHFAATIGSTSLSSILLNECGAVDVNAKTINGLTPLHLAAGAGNIDVVQQLISHPKIQLNALALNNWTPLHFAISLRKNHTALMLLEKDATDVQIQTLDTKQTPLHLASLNAMPHVVNRLFQKGSKTNVKDAQNFTALHNAAKYCDDYILKKLINFDENINATNENDVTPLHVAIAFQNLKALQFLLKQNPPADLNAKTIDGKTGLHLAAVLNDLSTVEELLNHGAKINQLDKNNVSALYLALRFESLDVAWILVKNGSKLSKPYDNGMTLLDVAVQRNETLQILNAINKGNITDEFGLSSLQLATKYKNNEAFSKLLKDTKEVPSSSYNQLFQHTMQHFNQQNFDLLLHTTGTTWVNEQGKSPLHLAAESDYFEAAKALIQKDSRLVNATDNSMWSPLHTASMHGHCRIASLLINSSANVNALSRYTNDLPSETPSVSSLFFAARNGHLECVKLLLKNGAQVNHQVKNGYTALHVAAKYNKFNVVKTLVDAGANITLLTDGRWTALQFAGVHKKPNYKLVRYLALKTDNPVHDAVKYNMLNYLQALIKANISVEERDEDQFTPLHIAAQDGFLDAAKLLVQAQLNLVHTTDSFHQTPLHLAAINGQKEIIELLLKNGANVNALSRYGNEDQNVAPSVSVLIAASSEGHTSSVKALLDAGAQVNYKANDGFTALHIATKENHFDTVKKLVEAGAKTNLMTNENLTSFDIAVLNEPQNPLLIQYLAERIKHPILGAVHYNMTDLLKALVKANISVDERDANQESPLHIAAQFGYVEIAQLLIQTRPQLVNTTDKLNQTPLHVAAKEGKSGIIKLLLKSNIDVNALCRFDYEMTSFAPSVTALYLATTKGFAETVQTLLRGGAEINLRANNGFTALHYAAQNNFINTLKVLIDNGAKTSIKTNLNKTALQLAEAHTTPNQELINYIKNAKT